MNARLCFLILAYVPFVQAGIRPSFWLSHCVWDATDILELAVTPGGEGFRVVAAIKGGTQPDAAKVFPELAHRAQDHGLLEDLVISFPCGFGAQRCYEVDPPIRDVDRLIVFLRPGDEPANETMLTSTVWLQDGFVYAFAQTNNPGPTHLIPLLSATEVVKNGVPVRQLSWKKESEIRDEIHRLLELRATFANAVANHDTSERVADLARLVRSGDNVVVRSVLAKLSNDGPEAAHALRPLLDDDSLIMEHFEILDAIARTGAHDIFLDSVLVREKTYWEQTCPERLDDSWVRSYGQPPAYHCLRIVSALKAIQALGLKDDLQAVRTFNELIRHCQALSEQNELTELTGDLLRQ